MILNLCCPLCSYFLLIYAFQSAAGYPDQEGTVGNDVTIPQESGEFTFPPDYLLFLYRVSANIKRLSQHWKSKETMKHIRKELYLIQSNKGATDTLMKIVSEFAQTFKNEKAQNAIRAVVKTASNILRKITLRNFLYLLDYDRSLKERTACLEAFGRFVQVSVNILQDPLGKRLLLTLLNVEGSKSDSLAEESSTKDIPLEKVTVDDDIHREKDVMKSEEGQNSGGILAGAEEVGHQVADSLVENSSDEKSELSETSGSDVDFHSDTKDVPAIAETLDDDPPSLAENEGETVSTMIEGNEVNDDEHLRPQLTEQAREVTFENADSQNANEDILATVSEDEESKGIKSEKERKINIKESQNTSLEIENKNEKIINLSEDLENELLEEAISDTRKAKLLSPEDGDDLKDRENTSPETEGETEGIIGSTTDLEEELREKTISNSGEVNVKITDEETNMITEREDSENIEKRQNTSPEIENEKEGITSLTEDLEEKLHEKAVSNLNEVDVEITDDTREVELQSTKASIEKTGMIITEEGDDLKTQGSISATEPAEELLEMENSENIEIDEKSGNKDKIPSLERDIVEKQTQMYEPSEIQDIANSASKTGDDESGKSEKTEKTEKILHRIASNEENFIFKDIEDSEKTDTKKLKVDGNEEMVEKESSKVETQHEVLDSKVDKLDAEIDEDGESESEEEMISELGTLKGLPKIVDGEEDATGEDDNDSGVEDENAASTEEAYVDTESVEVEEPELKKEPLGEEKTLHVEVTDVLKKEGKDDLADNGSNHKITKEEKIEGVFVEEELKLKGDKNADDVDNGAVDPTNFKNDAETPNDALPVSNDRDFLLETKEDITIKKLDKGAHSKSLGGGDEEHKSKEIVQIENVKEEDIELTDRDLKVNTLPKTRDLETIKIKAEEEPNSDPEGEAENVSKILEETKIEEKTDERALDAKALQADELEQINSVDDNGSGKKEETSDDSSHKLEAIIEVVKNEENIETTAVESPNQHVEKGKYESKKVEKKSTFSNTEDLDDKGFEDETPQGEHVVRTKSAEIITTTTHETSQRSDVDSSELSTTKLEDEDNTTDKLEKTVLNEHSKDVPMEKEAIQDEQEENVEEVIHIESPSLRGGEQNADKMENDSTILDNEYSKVETTQNSKVKETVEVSNHNSEATRIEDEETVVTKHIEKSSHDVKTSQEASLDNDVKNTKVDDEKDVTAEVHEKTTYNLEENKPQLNDELDVPTLQAAESPDNNPAKVKLSEITNEGDSRSESLPSESGKLAKAAEIDNLETVETGKRSTKNSVETSDKASLDNDVENTKNDDEKIVTAEVHEKITDSEILNLQESEDLINDEVDVSTVKTAESPGNDSAKVKSLEITNEGDSRGESLPSEPSKLTEVAEIDNPKAVETGQRTTKNSVETSDKASLDNDVENTKVDDKKDVTTEVHEKITDTEILNLQESEDQINDELDVSTLKTVESPSNDSAKVKSLQEITNEGDSRGESLPSEPSKLTEAAEIDNLKEVETGLGTSKNSEKVEELQVSESQNVDLQTSDHSTLELETPGMNSMDKSTTKEDSKTETILSEKAERTETVETNLNDPSSESLACGRPGAENQEGTANEEKPRKEKFGGVKKFFGRIGIKF